MSGINGTNQRGRRVLVLGTTGVDKGTAISNLLQFRRKRTSTDNIEAIDFEHDYIRDKLGVLLHDYLDSHEDRQRSLWQRAWAKLRERLDSNPTRDIVLSIHGTLVRPLYGCRFPASLDALREFAPSVVVTLIDDVYSMWKRAELRAEKLEYMKGPAPEQLLSARRAELYFGDILVANLGGDPLVKHYLLAVRHPARVLDCIAFGPSDPELVYLSFPITKPRQMAAKGDHSGIDEVNGFLRKMAEFQRMNPNIACFCPLSIDELPLIETFDDSASDQEYITFDVSKRWDTGSFYEGDILLTDPKDKKNPPPMLRSDLADARGLILSDVGLRDRRLVLQSKRLVVFDPCFEDPALPGDNSVAGGVENEIACAGLYLKPVHICQEKRRDPEGVAMKTWKGSRSRLGARPGAQYVSIDDSLDELLSRLPV